MKTKVKICGIKTTRDAEASIRAGADFLGFNFVPTSKRYIRPDLAKEIIERLTKNVAKVGVFMDAEFKKVNDLIRQLKLDYVQLHGNESPKYIKKIKNAGIIKAFSLPSKFDIEKTIEKMKRYKVDYFLLDRKNQGRGELLNHERIKQLTSTYSVILAGGLTPRNIAEVVRAAKPQAVDVASGVETNGKKDIRKIKKIMKIIKTITGVTRFSES